ncbi:hypothetical protein COF64_18860 [Bacillus sp. AFS043905]|uniref:hypothetical protein n=1 Tax=Peribacillus frigoritolerans TaxID=450367 RepID=UPI000BFE6462|nr:hypothetical protein [Peribacillus frigoritolerans]PHD73112.1 hypothetical protein COF64_18860 [Bacillus sp. AFS043905]TWE03153.1 hypothetical protein FB545_0201 [Peribacillus frigoritolerans]
MAKKSKRYKMFVNPALIILLSISLFFSMIVPNVQAAGYVYKSGGITYDCTTVKTMSAINVKKAAAQMSSFSNKVNGLTLAVGWFNKYIGTGMGVFAIGLGISTSKWNNAAAAGKKAKQDHCVKRNWDGYSARSIARYIFY